MTTVLRSRMVKAINRRRLKKLKLSGQDIEVISENTFYEMLNFEA